MAAIRIATEGLDQVLGQFNALPHQIERASKRTIAKGTQFAAREVRRGLAAKLGMPQKVLRDRKRIATKPGLVWIGIAPIPVIYLGQYSQTKAGAKVGKNLYSKSFIAKMPSGHIGVFRRSGKSRLPIQEIKQSFGGAEQIVETVRQQTASRLPIIMKQELNYEVNVRGAR